ncbi:MAG: phenylalanine--tRNA ligase subunit alpha [Elusimicrobia bacterium]|nr:phenylalanine--tRNA ligase subunit alpha [Candidatus Liberimonas magnetica]
MDIKEKLDQLKKDCLDKISRASTLDDIEAIRIGVLGRKGTLTDILKSLSGMPVEEKKEVGKNANLAKVELESLIETKVKDIQKNKISEKIEKEKVDTSLPPYPFETGHYHPLRQTLNEISQIFEEIGFKIEKGPEIETEWFNFEALNIPQDHPARDVQDTFFLKDNGPNNEKLLLRTHTSPVQIHVMEKQKPPLKIIAPGRVFRNEATDATHSAVFHQIEGLAVDKKITFSDLKGSLTYFIHRYFGSNVNLRFRPSHFQFTEPSAEVDIQCTICKGKGCRVCKNSGWLEMLGCGMVHPNVFKAVKLDPEKYTGFAFGLGIERLSMFKYGIEDIRLFYENNLSFLKQF